MHATTFTAEPGRQDVIITRTLAASRQRVFRVMTDPALLPRWWGPAYLSTTVVEMDLRPGGRWRYVQRDPAGPEYGFHGVYHSVVPPESLVYTFEYEGAPGRVILETVTLEDAPGGTRLTERATFQSVADRDEMLREGMEDGAVESLDRLAALVAQSVD